MHAHLACIETAEENEFLRRLLKEIRGKLQLLKSEITVSIANKTSFYKIIDVLNDITFHNTYATSINSVIAKLSFIHIN